jgi:hypothetical protein
MKDRLNKADGLEETVRRQELVIEKLEAMINNYMKQKRTGGLKISCTSIRSKLFLFHRSF